MVDFRVIASASRLPPPRTEFPQALLVHLWKSGSGYLKPSRNPLIRLLKSGSFFRSSSTFRIEWITVEWCFPPKLRPISGKEARVRDLQRYIATCRGMAIDFE